MSEQEGKRNFWIGNVLLLLAFAILLNMGSLWEQFGVAAMAVWVVIAGLGGYFLMNDGSK